MSESSHRPRSLSIDLGRQSLCRASRRRATERRRHDAWRSAKGAAPNARTVCVLSAPIGRSGFSCNAATCSDDVHVGRRSDPCFWKVFMNRKLVVVAVIAGGITVASASAAAAGALPGAAQDTAAEALAKVGMSVPGANEHSGDHPNTRGSSGDAGTTTDDAKPASAADTNADEIVAIATDPSIVGLDKGQAVSTLAVRRSQPGRSSRSARIGARRISGPCSCRTSRRRSGWTSRRCSCLDLPQTFLSDLPQTFRLDPRPMFRLGLPETVPAGPPADVPAGPPVVSACRTSRRRSRRTSGRCSCRTSRRRSGWTPGISTCRTALKPHSRVDPIAEPPHSKRCRDVLSAGSAECPIGSGDCDPMRRTEHSEDV